MGWAQRTNPTAQAKRRGELAPRATVTRPTLKRFEHRQMWAALAERLLRRDATKDAA
jgi:hypothetical protein